MRRTKLLLYVAGLILSGAVGWGFRSGVEDRGTAERAAETRSRQDQTAALAVFVDRVLTAYESGDDEATRVHLSVLNSYTKRVNKGLVQR